MRLDQFFGAFDLLSDKMLGLLIRPPTFMQIFEGGESLILISTTQDSVAHVAAVENIIRYRDHSNVMVHKQIASFEKTKQQREWLTLSDISPDWAKRLGERRHLPVPLSITWLRWYLDLKRTSKCVVGEAYGYSSSFVYDCKDCDDIGWRMMLYFTVYSFSKLKENTQRFVNHWNKEHT